MTKSKPIRLENDEWRRRNAEPWRLRCPECDCTTIHRKTVKPYKRRTTMHGHAEIQHSNRKTPMKGQYWCQGCEEQSAGLLDVKTGQVVCRMNDYVPQEIYEWETSPRNRTPAIHGHEEGW